jgi:ribosomal protein L11 methyltransferase
MASLLLTGKQPITAMNHIQIIIHTSDSLLQETLIALLADTGFDGFEQNDDSLQAFANESAFNEEVLQQILEPFQVDYSKQSIAKQNWNQLWESNFKPVQVDDFVGIRADFHEPLKGVAHQIIITPKMSFGTGHHATTYSVMKLMQEVDFAGKTVFDFGTGTGILAILAEKLGAIEILAVDNDPWCIENGQENAQRNDCKVLDIQLANTATTTNQFDVVIANINKNIILDNLSQLHEALLPKGVIILSGLLVEDEADILQAVQAFGWQHQKTMTKNNWIAMLLVNQ